MRWSSTERPTCEGKLVLYPDLAFLQWRDHFYNPTTTPMQSCELYGYPHALVTRDIMETPLGLVGLLESGVAVNQHVPVSNTLSCF